MLRRLAPLIALSTLALSLTATAQRPFIVPNYYVSQLPVLTPGVAAAGELTEADGQSYKDGAHLDLYQFEGVVGAYVELELRSYDFDTFLSVFDPAGNLVEANDDADYDGGDANRSYVSLYVDQEGRYTVVASAYAQYGLGAYELRLDVQPSFSLDDATVVTVPGVIDGALAATDPVVPEGWTGPSRAYRFTLESEVALKIDAASSDFDTYLYLFDAAGRLLASNDDHDYSEASGYATDSQIFAALAPGEYVVYVSSWSGEAEGDFTLTFQEYVPRN